MFIFHALSTTLRFVRFEFDAAKSTSNLAKHGIDFTAAEALV